MWLINGGILDLYSVFTLLNRFKFLSSILWLFVGLFLQNMMIDGHLEEEIIERILNSEDVEKVHMLKKYTRYFNDKTFNTFGYF